MMVGPEPGDGRLPAGGGGGGGKPPHDGHPLEPDGDFEEEEEEEKGKGKGKGGAAAAEAAAGGGGCAAAGFHGLPFPPVPFSPSPPVPPQPTWTSGGLQWPPQQYLDLRCSTLALLKRRALSPMQSLTGLQHYMCCFCLFPFQVSPKKADVLQLLVFLQVLPRLQHHELHQEEAVC